MLTCTIRLVARVRFAGYRSDRVHGSTTSEGATVQALRLGKGAPLTEEQTMSNVEFNKLAFVQRRIDLFEQDVEEWKKDHDEANRCWEFEQMLKFGIEVYNLLIEVDEQVRLEIARSGREFTPKLAENLRGLFQWWLRPCERVEARLAEFEAKFGAGEVEFAAEFRERHREARWMLASAAEAVADDKMVEARDEAIDELRQGKAD